MPVPEAGSADLGRWLLRDAFPERRLRAALWFTALSKRSSLDGLQWLPSLQVPDMAWSVLQGAGDVRWRMCRKKTVRIGGEEGGAPVVFQVLTRVPRGDAAD